MHILNLYFINNYEKVSANGLIREQKLYFVS